MGPMSQDMGKMKNINSTASKLAVLKQLCNLIPAHALSKLVREHDSERDARSFSHWSHALTLLTSKSIHCFGLNDLCDQTDIHSGVFRSIRGATPAHRNTLSHANKTRPSAIGEGLFWETLGHLTSVAPGFGKRSYPGKLGKMRKAIHIMDSTVIELCANCMDWARHRRRKAAAKAHVRLNFESLLPGYVVVDTARESDVRRARELTSGLKEGEIVVFDRGYTDHGHFADLGERGVSWVTRMKEGTTYTVVERREVSGRVHEDEVIDLSNGTRCRRVRATVEVDGEDREMVFLTNHLEWSADTVTELYRARWQIEVFFKQLKQTLKLSDLISYSANGIRWQIWMALLLHLLMRYVAWVSQWAHSYVRLFAMVRGVLWQRIDLLKLLERYGTGKGSYKNLATPAQAYLPGMT